MPHLNTYVMGLQPLESVLLLQWGGGGIFLTSKVNPRAVKGNYAIYVKLINYTRATLPLHKFRLLSLFENVYP